MKHKSSNLLDTIIEKYQLKGVTMNMYSGTVEESIFVALILPKFFITSDRSVSYLFFNSRNLSIFQCCAVPRCSVSRW